MANKVDTDNKLGYVFSKVNLPMASVIQEP